MWEDILGIKFGLLGSGLGLFCHKFNVGLMRFLGVGLFFEMSIISCSKPLCGT